MSRRRAITILGMLAVLWLGFGVRLWRLDAEAVWHDEGWSIRAIQSPFGTPDDNTPYAYYTVMHLFGELGRGDSVFALRYGSVLLGVMTVAVAMGLGRRWYNDAVGWAAGVMVAVSPLMWDYAQEIRAYVAVPLLGLVFLALAERFLRVEAPAPSKWWWLGLVAAEIIGIYTHNLVIPLVVWLNVAVGSVWFIRSDWGRLVQWAFSQSLVVVSYLPWLATQAPSGTPLNSTPSLGWALVVDIWRGYFLPVLPQLRATDDTLLIDIFALAVLVGLVGLGLFERNYRGWLLASHLLLVPFLSAVLIIAAHIDFHPRYFVAAVPVTLLAVAAGVWTWRVLLGTKAVTVALAGLVLWSAVISRTSLDAIATTRTYQHDDFAALADYYATLPATAVIVIPFNREPALQDYYAEQKGIKARFVNIPLYSDEDKALEIVRRLYVAGEHRHIELLTWFQLPADVRGMYPCILTASTNRPVPEPRYFFGLATQPYALSTAPRFAPMPARPTYEFVRLEQAAVLSSTQATCLRTTWTTPTALPEDLSVVAELFYADTRVARADNTMALVNQVPSGQWAAGQIGSAYNLLMLPVGAPRAEYDLRMRVYSPSVPNGLKLLGESVGVQGTDYPYPEPLALVGAAYPNPPAEPVLVADNAPEDNVLDGTQPLDVTVLISGLELGAFNRVSVRLYGADEAWQVRRSAEYDGSANLAWLSFNVPPDVQGPAYLAVGDVVVATYTINQPERITERPDFAIEVNAKFPSVGNIIGMDAPQTVNPTEDFQVTLIWQANLATDTAYVVFVQLLDAEGNLLAQSDSEPVGGSRPTTSWLAGEYLIDNHRLTFRVNTYEGSAILIAGLYDPATATRVLNGDGGEFVTLPITVTVSR